LSIGVVRKQKKKARLRAGKHDVAECSIVQYSSP
jgi:hypothetical protein